MQTLVRSAEDPQSYGYLSAGIERYIISVYLGKRVPGDSICQIDNHEKSRFFGLTSGGEREKKELQMKIHYTGDKPYHSLSQEK